MMKNKIFLVLVLIVGIISGLFYLGNHFILKKVTSAPKGDKNFVFYEINDKKLKLLVADEPQEWTQGLMFVKKPVDFDGMIFIFPDKQIRYFWNKNTFVDLEVYWLDEDKIVGKNFLPSIEKIKEIYTIQSPLPVNKVIEVII